VVRAVKRTVRGRCLGGAALATLTWLLAGCAFPRLDVQTSPNRLRLPPGENGTVTVSTTDQGCDEDLPFLCVDTTGQVFDVVVQHVPEGITHHVDTTLRSPSTPGVARITFEAGPAAVPGDYTAVVHAVLLGRSLGHDLVNLVVLPTARIASHPPVAVAGGDFHSLAALADGSVWAWGGNFWGQLGDGSVSSRTLPVAARNVDGIVGVAGGVDHSLALTASGRVWAWGENDHGQLGVGDRIGRTLPVRVEGIHNIQAIAAGWGYSLALKSDGTVWAWGRYRRDASRQRVDILVPEQVPGLGSTRAIAAGNARFLAVATDGTVWVWGWSELVDPAAPAQIPGLSEIRAVADGSGHSLALAADGTVWAWGENRNGELGDGTMVERVVPVQVQGLSGVRAIAVGNIHSLALAADGTVWAWGDLGQTSSPVPTQVPELRGVQAIAAGAFHSLAWQDCGQLWAWGSNHNGQLGDGTRQSSDTPFPVSGVGTDATCSMVGLRISPAGDGEGTVTSARVDLDCDALDCRAIVPRGGTVDLTASAAAGSVFEGWTIDCQGADLRTTVVMDRSKLCAARFRRATSEPFLLTVHSGGGHVVSTGGGILGPDHIDCGTTCHTIFPADTVVTLTATSSDFTGWSGDCTGTASQAVVVMNRARTCRASFGRFSLTMAVDGQGSVTSAPAGINCPAASCDARYPSGTAVDLTAHPSAGSMVSLWLDDCAAPGTLTNRIVMDADKRCRIRFVPQAEAPRALFGFTPAAPRVGQIVTFDGNASCVFDPATGVCDLAKITSWAWDFDDDGTFEASGGRTAAAIAAHAFQAPGDHPVRLRVEGGQFFGQADTVSIVPVLGASPLFGLTIAKAGSGAGTIATVPPGLIGCGVGCTGAGPVLLEAGSVVTLTAAPVAGSSFGGWSGAGCASGTATIQVTMAAARTCTATFTPDQVTLTVSNGGNGRVVSSPLGIDCGADCSESYVGGTSVTLTAIPVPGFRVGAWLGCDTFNANQCTVIMGTNRTVSVTFTPLPS
jgi:alpha-tubulin suppressor-like RCC1 family protein